MASDCVPEPIAVERIYLATDEMAVRLFGTFTTRNSPHATSICRKLVSSLTFRQPQADDRYRQGMQVTSKRAAIAWMLLHARFANSLGDWQLEDTGCVLHAHVLDKV